MERTASPALILADKSIMTKPEVQSAHALRFSFGCMILCAWGAHRKANERELHMCLYPRLILNKKYLPNRKNGGNPPKMRDIRTKYVPIGCGNCIECRQQIANAWRTRLMQEFQEQQKTFFVTLTINNDTFEEITKTIESASANAIATILVRRWLERVRKKTGKSVKHWFITELGENTDRLHLHGFIFCEEDKQFTIVNCWKYGNTYVGDYCNERTINYCVKYALKIDEKHKDYKFIILNSPGIGKGYIERNKQNYYWDKENTKEYMRLNDGTPVNLPIYYRNHLFTENEREKLWLQRIDKQTIYVRGIECDVSNEEAYNNYMRVLEQQQKLNEEMGYGNNNKEWKKKDYNVTFKRLNAKRKLQNKQKIT